MVAAGRDLSREKGPPGTACISPKVMTETTIKTTNR